jgi:glycosyltransferase involved in cell wall biosynthesis
MQIAIVHDYLTQRGGAERVVLSMLRAFAGAPLYTALYDPAGTFPAFAEAHVRPLFLDRLAPLRRRHRLALPLLAPAFSRLHVPADVVLCSTSGWAHGTRACGRKVVYCYAPARWLYQADRYLQGASRSAQVSLALLRPYLLRWDRRAAASGDRYLTSSTWVRDRIRAAYRIDAEVVPPPHTLDANGRQQEVERLEPGFFLCVSRLLRYKNVDAIVRAFSGLRDDRLVIVGTGPDEPRLRASAGENVTFLGSIDDEELRWLYANAASAVSASYEDYGLTPLEAAAFGKPTAALRWGGFVDTVEEGTTGIFFERPDPAAVRDAVRVITRTEWNTDTIRAHAGRYSEPRFIERLREIVAEEAATVSSSSEEDA